jgi:hypothetical protein
MVSSGAAMPSSLHAGDTAATFANGRAATFPAREMRLRDGDPDVPIRPWEPS